MSRRSGRLGSRRAALPATCEHVCRCLRQQSPRCVVARARRKLYDALAEKALRCVDVSQLVFPDRDALDFNIKRARPYRHTEENAGWRIVGRVALVDFVECLEALGLTQSTLIFMTCSRSDPPPQVPSSTLPGCVRPAVRSGLTRISPVLGSNGGRPEMKIMLPPRVQVETGTPHFSKLLSNGSTRIISLFTICLLALLSSASTKTAAVTALPRRSPIKPTTSHFSCVVPFCEEWSCKSGCPSTSSGRLSQCFIV